MVAVWPFKNVAEMPAIVNWVTDRGLFSTSVSLANTFPVAVVPAVVLLISSEGNGASFTSVTVMVKVALVVPPFASLIP